METDLNTKIINTGRFKVIEKNLLDGILKELKFGYEGLTDPTQSKQFGKMSQADAILTGTYFEKGKQIQIIVKLINIETGEVVWADNVSVLKEEIPLGVELHGQWVWKGNLAGRQMNRNNVIDYCENLVYAGYSDWRLPTSYELKTLVNKGE